MPLFSRRSRSTAAAAPELTQAPQALVAAATRLSSPAAAQFRRTIKKSGWQAEGYRQYDLSGELRYAVNWMGNSLSRVRLTINDVDASGRVGGETSNAEVQALMADIIGDPVLVSTLLHDFGLAVGIAGDAYLCEVEPGDWLIVGVDAISEGSAPGTATIILGDDRYEIDQTRVIRIHRPHPRRWEEADSPTRGALPILREIEELSKYQFATISSRLAGAGILGIASELSFPASQDEVATGETPFMATLADAMLTPISDPGDPSAVVPIVVQGPKESLPSQDNWITPPNSELTSVVAEQKEAAIRRLAVALDIPTEILLGGVDASRWHSWQSEESAIKIHIEPLAFLFANGITTGILRERLEAAGLNPNAWVISVDSTELVSKPDMSANALVAHERGLISDEALRRYLGFSEDDAPTGEELCRNKALEVVRLAPAVIDNQVKAIGTLLGWDKCGIDLDEAAEAGLDPAGGTPQNGDAPDRPESDRPEPEQPE